MPKRTHRGMQQPEGHAMQWQDMPRGSKGALSDQMSGLGMAKSSIPERRQKLEETRDRPGNLPRTSMKATQRLSGLTAMEPHLQDKPITMRGASSRRESLVKAGGQRMIAEGTDPGHDWYFQHNRKLGAVAHSTGHSKESVVAASAVMSPQNNPEQELSAVHALAQAHSNPSASISITPATVAKHPDLDDWTGRDVHPSQLSSGQLARLSEPDTRKTVQTKGVDLGAIAKGGVKGNVVKAIDVLRGNIEPHEAINPKSSPKVWSYHENIAKAAYGTPEHEEFTRRMRTATGTEHVGEVTGQQSMGSMFPQLGSATHGALNPTGHTAEDTWQQAISTGQRLEKVDVPGRSGRAAEQSPAKFSVGPGGAAEQKHLHAVPGMTNVGEAALMHSWQNRATQVAAQGLSRSSGEVIPTMGVQAGGWTEARRQAGKNIEEQETTRKSPSAGTQQEMFTPAGGITAAARPAAGNNTRHTKRQTPGQGSMF
jgi:hypothetical protein